MINFTLKDVPYTASSVNLTVPNEDGIQRLLINADAPTAYELVDGGAFNIALPDGLGVDLNLPEGQLSFCVWDFGDPTPGSLVMVSFDLEPDEEAQLTLALEED
jgi:hypothetical protein